MPRAVRIYDSVLIQGGTGLKIPQESAEKVKFIDNFLASGKGLLVTVKATHAAKLTRNNGFYLPEKMKAGAKTMLSREAGGTSAFPKPVLVNHDSLASPIGRIVAAEYVDLTQGVGTEVLQKNTLLHDLAKPTPLWRAIDVVKELVKTGLLLDPDYRGLGYIKSTGRITDPEAITRILDDRYFTVSTGATSNKAICSICEEDWASSDEVCGHVPGKTYDDMLCFLIAGDLTYEEWSFVTRPADGEAVKTGIQLIDLPLRTGTGYDSLRVDPGLLRNTDAEISLLDSFEGTIMPTKEELVAKIKALYEKISEKDLARYSAMEPEVLNKAVKDMTAAKAVVDEILAREVVKKDALQGESHFEIALLAEMHNSLHFRWDWETLERIPSAVFTVHAELMDMAEEGEWLDSIIKGRLDEFDGDGAEIVESRDSAKEGVQVQDQVMATLELDKIDISSDSITEAEVDFLNKELEKEVEAIVTDAKLTTAARKKLKGGTFCGPNRSYPVPDRSHGANALARAKQYASPELYARIKGCVCRKYPTLPLCKGKGDAAEAELEWAPELIREAQEKEDLILGTDAKLTEEARNKLPASAFCGPNRSFPVHDCAHFWAAKKLLGRYKGSGSKEKISACIDRKGKALDCSEEDMDTSPLAVEDILAAVITLGEEKEQEVFDELAKLLKKETQDKKDDCGKCSSLQELLDAERESSKEFQEQLGWVRREWKDAYDDYEQLRGQLEDSLAEGHELLVLVTAALRAHKESPAFSDLEKLQKEKPIDTLRHEFSDLQSGVDWGNIVVKPSGARTSVGQPVPDPTLLAGEKPAKADGLDKWQAGAVMRYKEILDTNGKAAAERYLLSIKRLRLVPVDFDVPRASKDTK